MDTQAPLRAQAQGQAARGHNGFTDRADPVPEYLIGLSSVWIKARLS
jgi:hypothetical protein